MALCPPLINVNLDKVGTSGKVDTKSVLPFYANVHKSSLRTKKRHKLRQGEKVFSWLPIPSLSDSPTLVDDQ